MKRDYRNVLDEAARHHVPDDIDLFPLISAHVERRIHPQGLRARPAFVILAVLFALGLLSGGVYAVGRSLGYIPGVGIVEQGAALRVLAAPVVVERDGITLTVTQGLASPEKTVINYQVEDIPESALARDPREGETPAPRCSPDDLLRLPDGRVLSPAAGQGGGWGLGFGFRETYDPLPADVDTVTLVVPCLLGTSPGKAPENWQVPLSFVAAPADMTIVPVVEWTASPPPTPEAGRQAGETPAPSPISIERTIELEDGYILIGSFHTITTTDGVLTSPYVWSVRITDSAGRDVGYDYADDIDLPSGDERTSPWAYRIAGKAHDWPLTVSVDSLEATLPDVEASFEFDTGPAPKPDQHWTLDQDLELAGHHARVLEATRTADGYAFSFQADPVVTGFGVDIRGPEGYIPPAGGGGGGDGAGSLSVGVAYSGPIPEGRLTVVLRNVTIRVPGPWSIQWEAQGAESHVSPVPSLGSAACLTDDVWARVRASVPAIVPAGLPGSFFIFGPNASGSAYGVIAVDPVSLERRFLFEGSWPVVSPDGAKIVYTEDQGLAVYDLRSGDAVTLPGTDPTDYRMVWSPDGSRIAFVRSSIDQIMTINVDGSDQRQVRDNSAIYHALVGWSDNTHLLITEPGPAGVYVQAVDLADGSSQDLFSISSNKADTVISNDGTRIAFTTSLGGMLGNGLYVSRLDGSERRLVASLDGRALYFPIWSPDNRWLILSLPDPDDALDQMRQALVELDSCRVIPLPDLGGDVYSWGR